MARSMAGGGNDRLASLNEELQNLMALKEHMWSQRSKSDWLQYGDQNIKYFHCKASERNKKNYISSIENAASVWNEEESQVGTYCSTSIQICSHRQIPLNSIPFYLVWIQGLLKP